MSIIGLVVVLAGCSSACPIPVKHEHSEQVKRIMAEGPAYVAEVEAVSAKTGEVIHRARGALVWNEKKHIGGEQLRDLPFDVPDYELNSALITPDKVWTST